MGKPDYDASGSALVGGHELLGESVETRSRLGLAQAFQYPTEIPGITLRELFEELAEQRDDGDAIRARVARGRRAPRDRAIPRSAGE